MKKKTVIEYYGTGTAVAKALGITRQAVSDWGEDVPESSAWKIQCLTNGELQVNDEKADQVA